MGIDTLKITNVPPSTAYTGDEVAFIGTVKLGPIGLPFVWVEAIKKGGLLNLVTTTDRIMFTPNILTGEFQAVWAPSADGDWKVTVISTPAPADIPLIHLVPVWNKSSVYAVKVSNPPAETIQVNQPVATPKSANKGDIVTITIPVKSNYRTELTGTCELDIKEGSAAWWSGATVGTVTKEFTLKSLAVTTLTFTFDSTDTGDGRRDVGLKVTMPDGKSYTGEFDDVFTVSKQANPGIVVSVTPQATEILSGGTAAVTLVWLNNSSSSITPTFRLDLRKVTDYLLGVQEANWTNGPAFPGGTVAAGQQISIALSNTLPSDWVDQYIDAKVAMLVDGVEITVPSLPFADCIWGQAKYFHVTAASAFKGQLSSTPALVGGKIQYQPNDLVQYSFSWTNTSSSNVSASFRLVIKPPDGSPVGDESDTTGMTSAVNVPAGQTINVTVSKPIPSNWTPKWVQARIDCRINGKNNVLWTQDNAFQVVAAGVAGGTSPPSAVSVVTPSVTAGSTCQVDVTWVNNGTMAVGSPSYRLDIKRRWVGVLGILEPTSWVNTGSFSAGNALVQPGGSTTFRCTSAVIPSDWAVGDTIDIQLEAGNGTIAWGPYDHLVMIVTKGSIPPPPPTGEYAQFVAWFTANYPTYLLSIAVTESNYKTIVDHNGRNFYNLFLASKGGGGTPSLTLSPTSLAQGATMAITLSSFQANSLVILSVAGGGGFNATTDSSGGGTWSLTIGDAPGVHTWTATDSYGHTATASYTVTGGSPSSGRSVTIANSTITQGGYLSFTLSGFTPGQALIAQVVGGGQLTLQADSSGGGAWAFQDNDPPGTYLLNILDSSGNLLRWAKFTIV